MKNIFINIIVLFTFCCGVNAQQTDTIRLSEAIKSALENNNLIRIKQLQEMEYLSKISESKIKWFPVVGVSSAYQYNANLGALSIPAGSFGALPLGGTLISLPSEDVGFDLGKHNTFNVGVTAYQPITQLSKIKTGVDVAKTEHDISSLELTSAELKVANAVEQLFLGIMVVRKRKEEAQKNIEVAKLKLFDVESALLSGKTIEANIAGLNAAIADEEQELLKLDFEEEDYIAEFKKVTGITSDEFQLVDEENDDFIDKGLEDYTLEAESKNIDIQLAQLQKQKSEMGIQAAKRSNLPEIGLIAGYTYQEGNIIYPKNNPFVGVNFKWNIQDLFSNKQVLNQRRFLRQQAIENEAYTQKQISVDVEKAYRKMKQAERLIIVAQKALTYRKEELKIEYDRRTAGLNTPLKVLETEAATTKAEADLYGAKQSHRIALSELKMLINNK